MKKNIDQSPMDKKGIRRASKGSNQVMFKRSIEFSVEQTAMINFYARKHGLSFEDAVNRILNENAARILA